MPKTSLDIIKIRLGENCNKNSPLYLEIYSLIRSLILTMVLKDGEKLPSTRKFAAYLSLSRDTVEKVYKMLEDDRLVVRKNSVGTFVKFNIKSFNSINVNQLNSDELPELNDQAEYILREKGIRDEYIKAPFVTGLPEIDHFPIQVWGKLYKEALQTEQRRLLAHSSPQGIIELRAEISDYLNLQRGANVSPEQIVIISGTRQALFLCSYLLVKDGQNILIEEPGFQSARKIFEAMGRKLMPISVDKDGVITENLEVIGKKSAFIYTTPSHQYPTGVTLSRERRDSLIQWAYKYKRWILEDDYDSEFHYEGAPKACIQGIDKFNRTIYVGTFNKTFFPGIRLAYMVLPKELVQLFVDARTLVDGYIPRLPQVVLSKFIANGNYITYIHKMQSIYQDRKNVLTSSIRNSLSNIFEIGYNNGGLQILCFFKKDIDEKPIINILEARGFKLTLLEDLYLNKRSCTRKGLLLGFSSLSEQHILKAILDIHHDIKNLNVVGNKV